MSDSTPISIPKAYSQIKKHWQILTLEVHYVERNEAARSAIARAQKMNIIVQERGRNIDARVMSEIRSAVMSRMKDQYKVEPEDIADYIINNISYMGHMSEFEYHNGYKPRKKG